MNSTLSVCTALTWFHYPAMLHRYVGVQPTATPVGIILLVGAPRSSSNCLTLTH